MIVFRTDKIDSNTQKGSDQAKERQIRSDSTSQIDGR